MIYNSSPWDENMFEMIRNDSKEIVCLGQSKGRGEYIFFSSMVLCPISVFVGNLKLHACNLAELFSQSHEIGKVGCLMFLGLRFDRISLCHTRVIVPFVL